MVNSGSRKGGNKIPPGPIGPGRFKAPRAGEVLPQVLWDLSQVIERMLEAGPSPERITLRTIRGTLLAAFPNQFRVNEVQLAQELAEMDGEALDC